MRGSSTLLDEDQIPTSRVNLLADLAGDPPPPLNPQTGEPARPTLRAAFDEAEAAKQAGEERVILVNVFGHGHFDTAAYQADLAGDLKDMEMPESELEAALERRPEAPALA